MDPYRYVLKQRAKDGSVWTSPEIFRGDYHEVKRAVVAGYLNGEPRWAETDCGMFLYGLDAFGKAHQTGTCSPDFSL